MSPQAQLDEAVTDVEVQASEDAAALAERMSADLELWNTPVEAGLFLAGVALAQDEDPVEASPAQTLGTLADAGEPEDLDPLAIVAIVEGQPSDPAQALSQALPGWIEAGAELVEPELAGADPVDATDAVVDLIQAAEA